MNNNNNKTEVNVDIANIDLEEFINNLISTSLAVNEDTCIQDIYDAIDFKNRSVYLKDVIENKTGTNLFHEISFWNIIDKDIDVNKRVPIKLYIDSFGGSLIDGFEVIDAITTSVTPVHTIVTGVAYSCGLMVALAGHKRYAYPHSSFLMHEGSISSGIQDAHKFKKYAEFYNTQLNQMKDFVLEHTNLTEEEYDKISKDDNWYTAEQALNKGFIDKIIR